MKHHRLEDMVKGWFIGDFVPAALSSREFEVGIKHYRAGESEDEHYHRVAKELTVIVSGEVRMLGRTWRAGDIITIDPGEASAFEALSEAVTVVVKIPSLVGDKFRSRIDDS